MVIAPASEHDGNVFKQEMVDYLHDKNVFADKLYQDQPFYEHKRKTQQLTLWTPFKKIKGEQPCISLMCKAARDLYSKAVSAVRQPIEACFNWLNEKSNIQRAHKVRSTKGLLVHCMGKIAAAYIYLIFNS